MSTISLNLNWCNKFVYSAHCLHTTTGLLKRNICVRLSQRLWSSASCLCSQDAAGEVPLEKMLLCDPKGGDTCTHIYERWCPHMRPEMGLGHSSAKRWHQRQTQVFCGQIVQSSTSMVCATENPLPHPPSATSLTTLNILVIKVTRVTFLSLRP